ncbi:MAG: magnesium transporter CorA family protein [Mesorhizobium sp.]
MLRIYAGQNGHLVPIAGLEALEGSRALWLDLYNPTADEVREVEQALQLDIPTKDEMAEIELSDRLYREHGAEFMTMTVVANIDESSIKSPVTFILKGETLVTVRHVEPRPFLTYAAKAQRESAEPCTTGEMTMLGLIEAVIDRTADALERISDEVDAISHDVFQNKAKTVSKKTRDLQSLIVQIGVKGDLLTKLRESLVSIQRLASYHGAVDKAVRKGKKDTAQRIRLIQRDAASLGDHAIFLSGKINFLLDATLGLINLEQNQIIKIFSVAAVVFLPPTMVASIYGMNFETMPELHFSYGYPLALGIMIASALLPFLYFKRRGWL